MKQPLRKGRSPGGKLRVEFGEGTSMINIDRLRRMEFGAADDAAERRRARRAAEDAVDLKRDRRALAVRSGVAGAAVLGMGGVLLRKKHAKVINRAVGRAGRLGKDAVAVVKGKPRERDAAGRKKKREWEKGWFKNAAGAAVTTAGLLGGAQYLRKNPAARHAVVRGAGKLRKRANELVPDLFPSTGLENLAALIEFDTEAARDAGWDVRDPRGRSARVFAPGSHKRARREKEWHEEIGNERKLWKAGIVAAGLTAAAGGVAVGRRFPRKVKAVVPKAKVVAGPWKKSG